MKNAINWFELPAIDLDRAQKFYETILGIRMIPLENPHIRMRLFPIEDPMTGVGGAIAKAEFYIPSTEVGPLVYLNANPDVQLVLDRIAAAGGRIVIPKTQISPEHGHMAVFIDSEGNRIALLSAPPRQ